MTLNPPSPEQFKLTQERINYLKKETEEISLITPIAIIVNFFLCLFLFDTLFRNVEVSTPIFLFLAIWPGFITGGKINEHRLSKIKSLPDYSNYMKYKEALIEYDDLSRKLRHAAADAGAKRLMKIEKDKRKKRNGGTV